MQFLLLDLQNKLDSTDHENSCLRQSLTEREKELENLKMRIKELEEVNSRLQVLSFCCNSNFTESREYGTTEYAQIFQAAHVLLPPIRNCVSREKV